MIEKYLTERGWVRISAGCCGFPKYSHAEYAGYKITVYRQRNKCTIMKNNLRCVPYDVSGEELEKVLEGLGIGNKNIKI